MAVIVILAVCLTGAAVLHTISTAPSQLSTEENSSRKIYASLSQNVCSRSSPRRRHPLGELQQYQG
jgi:hypothetical protein